MVRLSKSALQASYKKVLGSSSFSIRRSIERNSLIAVLLGYGLILYVILTLQPLQQKQRQERAFEHATTTIRQFDTAILSADAESPSGKSVDPDLLQQVLGQLSSYRLAICMHPKGVESELVTPILIDKALVEKTPAILLACERLIKSELTSALHKSDFAQYSVESGEVDLYGAIWEMHLVVDSSDEAEYQEILIWILAPTVILASLITILLTRAGIQQALKPLDEFGDLVESVTSGSLDKNRCELENEPLELKPLIGSFNALLDRLAESWNRQRKFANALSHELRTPITLIIGYTSRVLRRSGTLSESQRRQLMIVDEETRRLGRLTTDLLDIAREESGTMIIASEPFQVWKILEQVYSLNRLNHDARLHLQPISLELRQLWAIGDRDRLAQCLGNLIENAFKYSPEEETVELSCSSTKEYVSLQVRDHGPGVPEADQALIFEQFQRGSNTAQQPGSGIGLAVVRSLVKRMGGRVWVENAAEGGAIFVIELPRCPPPDPEYAI